MAKEGSTVSRSDGLVRHDRVGGAPVRRAAARPRQQVRPRPVRAVAGSRATRRSRSRSRSSTTSSGGSARGSSGPDDKAALGLIDRSAIVDGPSGRLSGGSRIASAPAACGRVVSAAVQPPADRADAHEPSSEDDEPRGLGRGRGASAARRDRRPSAARPELAADAARVKASSSPAPTSELDVIATNGHANGHAAARQWERQARRP